MSTDRIAADVAFIKALAELLNDNELTELAVKREYGEADTLNVKVSKHPPAAPHMVSYATPAAAPPPATPQAAPGTGNGQAAAPADPAEHPGAVTSPMVGTAYLSPEPGAEAFVSVGDQVAVGQTLMIIEAMKTMNQIPAPHAGTVKRILVADGTPVEYGAPLMIVE
jgi:acetyl-CoA carboxylase biotin carboxyl carrier protein